MKGKIVHHLVQSLGTEERERFWGRVRTLPNGNVLTKLIHHIAESDTYSDREVLRRFGLTRSERDRHVDELYHTLIHSLAEEATITLQTFTAAKLLVIHSQYDSAIEIIETGINRAAHEGNFQLILEFWKLVDHFHVTPVIRGMQREEATHHLKDNFLFQKWMDQLPDARTQPTGETRKTVLETIKKKATKRANKHELSPSARYLYLKLMAACHIMEFDHQLAVPVQEELVTHVTLHPAISLDPEFAIAKETRILSQYLWRTKEFERFKECATTLSAMVFTSRHARYEQIYQRFPFMIAVAIETNDVELGNLVCQEFFQLMDDDEYALAPTFITRCLYYCAYFYLATGNKTALSRVFTRLHRYSKSDFKPRYYLLSKFLKILQAIELEEWEDATVFCKSLKVTKDIALLPGLTITIDFLASLIKKQSSTETTSNDEIPTELKTNLDGLELLKYFDLFVWLESKATDRPMIELLNHQTKSIEGK